MFFFISSQKLVHRQDMQQNTYQEVLNSKEIERCHSLNTDILIKHIIIIRIK